MPQILKKVKEVKKVYMEILIYGIIFIIGTLFGSFFTLAVYRIPLGEDILYKHSFCPNCKNKLKFKDLIPVLSYIFLGGKCSYCGQKIRIRYLLLEILSGFVFLLFALSLKMDVFNLNINMIIYFLLFILYIASLFIIAGIDKENIYIQKSLLVFGLLLSFTYMTYVCIQNKNAIYTYIIYLVLTCILLFADTLFLKKKLYQNYTIQVLMLVLYMVVFTGDILGNYTIILALGLIALELTIKVIREKAKRKIVTKEKENIKLPIGFYLCTSNIFLVILYNFLCNWVIK